MTSISAREFNRDVSAAKRAARSGPVVITDRGTPSYVLLTKQDYDDLRGRDSLVDRLCMDADDDLDEFLEPADLDLDERRIPSF